MLTPPVLLLSKAAGLHLHRMCLTEGSAYLKGVECNQKLALHVRPMITQ